MVPIKELLAGAEIHCQTFGRPLVTLSYAQSLDGCLALQREAPLALSGGEALQLTHRLRAAHDAILIGVGTLLADNPRLTVRLVAGQDPQPVVLDSRLRTPAEANVLVEGRKPWIATGENPDPKKQVRLISAGARLLPFRLEDSGRLPLSEVLARLAELGVKTLMVEGGARVITAFLEARLVDRLILTVTPAIAGGLRAVEGLTWAQLEGSTAGTTGLLRLHQPGYERLGDDLIVWGSLPQGLL